MHNKVFKNKCLNKKNKKNYKKNQNHSYFI